jgi:hypothetical protein
VVSLDFPTRKSAQLARLSFADKRAGKRRRVRIDGRSSQAVQIRQRIAGYAKALGGAASEPFVRVRLQELAEIEVLTSQLRVNGLNGKALDLFELTRLMNMQSRLRRSLGLSDRPPEPPPPTLESYRRRREATP